MDTSDVYGKGCDQHKRDNVIVMTQYKQTHGPRLRCLTLMLIFPAIEDVTASG